MHYHIIKDIMVFIHYLIIMRQIMDSLMGEEFMRIKDSLTFVVFIILTVACGSKNSSSDDAGDNSEDGDNNYNDNDDGKNDDQCNETQQLQQKKHIHTV